jgi:hypothetical protein
VLKHDRNPRIDNLLVPSGEVVRHSIRIDRATRQRLRERVAVRLPVLIRLGGVATLRLPLRSRLRGALLVYAFRLVAEAQNRGDFELTTRMYASDGELRNIPTGGAAASIIGLDEVYFGPAGVRRFFEQWTEPWEHWHWAPEGELIDLGHGRLLALLQLVGRGRGSGIEVREQVSLLPELEHGLAVRQRSWLGTGAWSEALRAVGLS